MERKKIHIELDANVKDKLDELSKKRGIKTSELIRFILSEYLLKNN